MPDDTAANTAKGAADRKSVRKFFDFDVNSDDLKPRKGKYVIAFWATLIAGGIAWFGVSQVVGIISGLAAGAFAIGIDRVLIQMQLNTRTKKKEENHAEFRKLATETRRIQAADTMKALMRVFERTMIDRNSLRVLEQKYVFETERSLFDEETLQDKLGDLLNKSIRMMSRGDFTNQRWRKIRWTDTRKEELFFNPIRLVALFLTETQLVICDVQIDSLGGDLREDIQRISLPKVVNIHFTAERKRLAHTVEELVRMAEDLDYSAKEIEDMKKALKEGDGDWVQEEMTSHLRITRTDGGFLAVPIRSEVFFGKHTSALDQDSALTENEIAIDRMINELNRLVEHAGGARAE
ncbi:hypothetical protein GC169_04085 [bacterium]|nr:hypothetical protein [bacterium]